MTDVKETPGASRSLAQPSVRAKSDFTCVRRGIRNQVLSPCGPRRSFKQDRPSHTSLRQLQAKMGTENMQVQGLLQPLLNRENGFMKELESFLIQTDVTELRRRELLHKRWTEHVWFPLQKRVTLRHYNSKFKTAGSKEMLYLQLHEKTGGKRPATSRQAGSKTTWSKTQELPQTSRSFSNTVMSPANQLPQTLPKHLLPTFTNVSEKDESKQRKSGTTPYCIFATSTLDKREHQRSR